VSSRFIHSEGRRWLPLAADIFKKDRMNAPAGSFLRPVDDLEKLTAAPLQQEETPRILLR
jgi:hypothetical protein